MAKQQPSSTKQPDTNTTITPEAVQSGSKVDSVITAVEHAAVLAKEVAKAAHAECERIQNYLHGFADKMKTDEPATAGVALEIINMLKNKWHHKPPGEPQD